MEDDEPVTEEEEAGVREAWEDYKAGRVQTLEEVEKELGPIGDPSLELRVRRPRVLVTPNPLTTKTLHDSEAGRNVRRFATADELFEDLDN